MIKALFFDIDGTLVSFKTHEIPVSTIEALTAAKAKGIHIFISTGRPRVIINNLSALQERNLIDGYITMNGAYCFVEDTVIYKSPIPTAEVDALTAFCHFINAEEEAIILPAVPHCEMGRWHPAFVDVTAKGNTKQNGIDQIIRHFGIKLEETMAFGDGGNDISMLRHAGIGVAMGNANDDVKAASNYTTTSVDEDGIANALKYFGIVGNPS